MSRNLTSTPLHPFVMKPCRKNTGLINRTHSIWKQTSVVQSLVIEVNVIHT